MPSIRFQSASKSAHTCSSRNNKKIHTEIHKHTHTLSSKNNNNACNTDSYTHTSAYIYTHTHTQQKLQRTPLKEWAPRPTQGPNSAIRWHHEAFAIIFISILVIDICTHSYIYDRQTDNQKQLREKLTHTITWKNSALSALVRAAGAFDSILFFAFYLLSERLNV